MRQIYRVLMGLLVVYGLAACNTAVSTPPVTPTLPAPPTLAVAAATLPVSSATPTVPPTYTAVVSEIMLGTPLGNAPTFTPFPTYTAFPTNTATPTNTPSITPTPTETPLPTPLPTNTPSAVSASGNYLPNPSFEGGWYHPNGDPELQVPDQWRLSFAEGANDLDSDSWNRWVKPEVRVLPKEFLPPPEWDDFIWHGDQTLKIFKGQGAINVRLVTTVDLEPGRYLFTIHVFPDLVEGYTEDGGKIWATDSLSGEVMFIKDGGRQTDWYLPSFGRKNTFTYQFDVFQPGPVEIGAGFRGRWAIDNNGWFMDDWSLERVPLESSE